MSWTEESVEPVEFRSRLADPSRVSPVGGFATVQRVRWPWARMARWQDFRFFGLLAFDGAWEVTREPSLGRAEAGGSRQLPVTLSRWRRFVVVPHWALIVVLGAWPALRWRRRRRLRARARAGQCVRCGYDLRGSPGRCPECGTDVTAEAMATARPSSG
ncbi:MAG: hypothetical protein ACAI43_22710 [Phycisphaerae bacterium]|nr:hypothetical protein [Tepidisphaeraceae bacterium]